MDKQTFDAPLAPPPPPPRPRFAGLRRRTALALTAAGLMAGAFGGGYVISHAATSSPSATTSPSTTTPSGGFHSNESTSHEAGESAAREAQENAGQVPTVP